MFVKAGCGFGAAWTREVDGGVVLVIQTARIPIWAVSGGGRFGQQMGEIPVWAMPVRRGAGRGKGIGDEVWGHVGGGEAWSGESYAGDF